jgi:L-cysteine S-thiosulfotransferase
MRARAGLVAATLMVALAIAGAAQAAADAAGDAAAGQQLAFDRAMGNCLACHTMKGGDVPSNVGPELVDIKTKFPNRQDLYAIIYDEESRNPQTVMPAFGKNLILSPQQINQIIDFLYTR